MLRKIRKVMPARSVAWLGAGQSVLEAVRMMKEKHVGSVLIMEATRVIGIFTEQDAVHRVMAEGRDPAVTVLGDVMTKNPDIVSGDQLVIEALRLMETGGYRHIPVVDGEEVIGVFSRSDFSGEEEIQVEGERHMWETI